MTSGLRAPVAGVSEGSEAAFLPGRGAIAIPDNRATFIAMTDQGDVTELLRSIDGGSSAAVDALFPRVYEELKGVAAARLRAERAGHTLSATALVHEAYLKLIRADSVPKSRAHFCAIAATAMRQILINHAESKRALKRDGNVVQITVDHLGTPAVAPALDLLALDDADFSDEKLSVLRSAAATRHFLVDQVIAVLGRMTFDSDKIEAAALLHSRVVDRTNWYKVYGALDFDSSRAELKQRVGDR